MEVSAKNDPLLVRACRHEVLERPPVWFMRQAGRYMPEYRALRQKYSFLESCKNVDIATEISLQPYHAFGMDAVIMFCDILIPPEAMGMKLDFGDKGPCFESAIRTRADVEALSIPDPMDDMGFVMNLLSNLRRELANDPDTALIGFAGCPWTLASYMIEGGVSKNFAHLRRMMYDDPDLLHLLLDKLTQTVTAYLNAQIEAGAQVVQLFDTWGGILDRAGYQEFIQPYHRKIMKGLNRSQTPVILYVNGSAHLLELMAEVQPDVISVDWLTTLEEARQRVGNEMVLQGNLDPIALLTRPDVLEPMVRDMITQGGHQNYIFNVGHGLIPSTPVENVRLAVDTVKSWNRQLATVGN